MSRSAAIPFATVIAVLQDDCTDAEKLAQKYNVSHQSVRLWKTQGNVRAKEAAAYILADGGTPILWTKKHEGRRLFTPEQVRHIRRSEMDSKELSMQYSCSSSMIRMIRLRRAYAHVEDAP